MAEEKFKSNLSGNEFPLSDKMKGNEIRNILFEFIKIEHPSFTEELYLSITELNIFRQKYISTMLSKELGQLSELENRPPHDPSTTRTYGNTTSTN